MTKRKCKRRINQSKLSCCKKRRTHSKTNSSCHCSIETAYQIVDIHYFDYLPLEILHYILDFLSVSELRTFASVSDLYAKWTLDYLKSIVVIRKRFNLSKLYYPSQDRGNQVIKDTLFNSLSCRLKIQPKLNLTFDSLGKFYF